MKRIPLCTLLLFTTVILGGLLPTSTPAEAHDWLGDCVVDFDNTFALTYIYGQARGNFGYPTGIDNSGELQPCNATHQACWTYRHRCFGNYINVDDMTYGHIHLVFDSPSLLTPCFVDPGDGPGAGFGRNVGDDCIAASVSFSMSPTFATARLRSLPCDCTAACTMRCTTRSG